MKNQIFFAATLLCGLLTSNPAFAMRVYFQPSTSSCTNPLARVSYDLALYSGNYNGVLKCRLGLYLEKLFTQEGLSLVPNSLSVSQDGDWLFPKNIAQGPLPEGKLNPYFKDTQYFDTFRVRFLAVINGAVRPLLLRTDSDPVLYGWDLSSVLPRAIAGPLNVLEVKRGTLRTLDWDDVQAEGLAQVNRWYRMQILDAETLQPVLEDVILPALSR